eukprot:TRINITY_DN5023_c0_g1_i1.p1 TRINITY_DN5023_c0_g1~~TRINITY_DN5023_c0_g1_i1.p1  ORF type:complete len:416 (+),score=79.81 TRINITY_DN5023_c0_g1_i1:275-1522(+)
MVYIYVSWNWILGGCDPKMPPVGPTGSGACKADVQNSSKYEIYYIAAYQWDGDKWNLDTTSSVFGKNQGVINGSPEFEKLKVCGTDSPYPPGGDWQDKWSPRTATTDTQGLGPPAFMYVLSAKSLEWMTFFSLMQKTINRGTEDQFAPPGYSNCWYAELDFLEAPFWSNANGERTCMLAEYPQASFMSTGAQFGGCFPMGMNMGNEFASECYTEWCCEATRCPDNPNANWPFMDPTQYGSSIAGCGSSTTKLPSNYTFLGPKNNPPQCTQFEVLGGCNSNSFFENDPETEYLFVYVVDKFGVWGYRWITTNEAYANSIWPGLRKYDSDPFLSVSHPVVTPTKQSPPCLANDEYCVMLHPGSTGQRPCVSAAGDPKFLDNMGVAAADGKNWWNLFQDTGQWVDSFDSSLLATLIPN